MNNLAHYFLSKLYIRQKTVSGRALKRTPVENFILCYVYNFIVEIKCLSSRRFLLVHSIELSYYNLF